MWAQNSVCPEKINRKGDCMVVKIDKKKCNGCGACANVCPVNAIKIENKKAVIGDDCIECGACISQCDVEAISI